MNQLLLTLFSVIAFGLAPSAWADVADCRFELGCVGPLKIGATRVVVERLIGRAVELQFAGEGRAGLTLDRPDDLRRLAISSPLLRDKVTSADVFFAISASTEKVEMIVLGIPCADVQLIRQSTESEGISTVANRDGNWRIVDLTKHRILVWGADVKPVCRYWLRAGRTRPP